jgi:hypothetical protein
VASDPNHSAGIVATISRRRRRRSG